jgi:protease I
MKSLILIADGFDDLQFFCPYYRLLEEGVGVTIASPRGLKAVGLRGYPIEADTTIAAVDPAEYDLLVIPGGQSPERLRLWEEAIGIARAFMDEERPVAAIGHGPQLLLSAGSLDGKQATSAPDIRDDLLAGGAIYHNNAIIRDGNLLTGRSSDDLPQFCRQLVAFLSARWYLER